MGTAQHPTMFQVESEKPSTCSGGGGGATVLKAALTLECGLGRQ